MGSIEICLWIVGDHRNQLAQLDRRKPMKTQNPDWFHWKGDMDAWKSLATADTAENRKRKTAENNRIRWSPIECRLVENAIWIIVHPLNSDGLYRKSYMNHRKLQETGNTAEKLAETSWIRWIPMGFNEKAICIIGNHRKPLTPLIAAEKQLKIAVSAESRCFIERAIWIIGNHWKQLTPLSTAETPLKTIKPAEHQCVWLQKLFLPFEIAVNSWVRRKHGNPMKTVEKLLETFQSAELRMALLKKLDESGEITGNSWHGCKT